MSPVTITISEASNKLAAEMHRSDELYNSIFTKIDESTEALTDQNVDANRKYDTLVSIEYLLVKVRFKASFEQLKVKSLLSDPNTPAALRGTFLKRAEYLSQILLKLNDIRDDISVIQRCVYAQQSRNFMK